jgi:hypothetical protein
MKQTSLCLIAAAAFGVLMATTTMASGQQAPQAPGSGYPPHGCMRELGRYDGCVAHCAPLGSTSSAIARCRRACWDEVNPYCKMDDNPPARALQAAPRAQGSTRN